MLDVKTSGRARLFENLRYETLVDTAEGGEQDVKKRIEPLTSAQADAFRDMAMRSLQPR